MKLIKKKKHKQFFKKIEVIIKKIKLNRYKNMTKRKKIVNKMK